MKVERDEQKVHAACKARLEALHNAVGVLQGRCHRGALVEDGHHRPGGLLAVHHARVVPVKEGERAGRLLPPLECGLEEVLEVFQRHDLPAGVLPVPGHVLEQRPREGLHALQHARLRLHARLELVQVHQLAVRLHHHRRAQPLQLVLVLQLVHRHLLVHRHRHRAQHVRRQRVLQAHAVADQHRRAAPLGLLSRQAGLF
mmetsp:Transcript_24741/g.63354  ORF Transcript_24741/g.63354 Transcript_24741/m.63354 type:complete len:200 (+) Transcript_24741:948-1547(+)